ncbi:hypothetical protein AVEN_97560-1 [Araneus ventricosus]|uniref:Uncharacterized protein n=1 Tax=Araneus ventricosus TaxID=182803 RepID=A0A4Y2F760_ARAVE|nr:hypothetical protein AVEN_97560-1 [Araneus ventricosus]
MRTTPELATPSPNFHATPTGGRLATTYVLTCNWLHTRRIFSGIGSRDLTTRPPLPIHVLRSIRESLAITFGSNDANELLDSHNKELTFDDVAEVREQIATTGADTSDPDPPEKKVTLASLT